MIPVLYQKRASDFENNGIGRLIDAVSCKVTEERNGRYELTLQYPISGAWYANIQEGSIIKARVNDDENNYQLFRIYKSSKPLKGIVTFYARHISYDLSGYPVKPFSIQHANAGLAANVALSSSLLEHNFVTEVDIPTNTDIPFSVTKPKSVRSILGGDEESILSTWDGEFEWDNFCVKFSEARGADNNTVIRYGKNLIDAKQERNINDCYTHFFPYAVVTVDTTDDTGAITGSTEQVITLSGDGLIELIDPEDIGHSKAYTLDITDMFLEDEEINETNLRTHADEYIATHDLGIPSVNITASFLDVWNTPEYSHIAALEQCRLCDIVTVYFEDLGINAKAKVIKTEFDCLLERYTKIEIGDAKNTLADTFSNIRESVNETQKSLLDEEKKATTALQNAIIEATNKITGGSGGFVVLNPPNYPEEILIMDTPLKSTAKNVWRWNSAGLGFSSNGYEGPYETAITMDGNIVADFITTGTLNAIKVKGSTIEGGTININGKFVVDELGNVTIRSGGGGRNYILDSDQSDTLGTQKKTYTLSESLVSGEKYTLSICFGTATSTSFVFTVGTQPILLGSNSVGKQTITQTFTAGSGVNGATSASLARTGSSIIYWVKLERGGIATDWSPAPENASEAIVQIIAQANEDRQNTSDAIAGINARADADRAAVGAVAQWQNDLEIGGRNLYIGSADFSGDKWNTIDLWQTESELDENGNVIKSRDAWNGFYQNIEAKKGDTFTLSAIVFGDGKCRAAFVTTENDANRTYVKTYPADSLSTTGTRAYATYTVTADCTLAFRIENTVADSKIKISSIKLEKGNIPTAWSPAPEDAINSMARIEAKADKNSAAVGLYVSYDSAGNPVADGSLIVKAINGQSTAVVNANRISLNGYISNDEETFVLTENGILKVKKAIIEADITGSTGKIGDWSFGTAFGETGFYTNQATFDGHQATVLFSPKKGIGLYDSGGWTWKSWAALLV